jgi:flagellar protein FlaJ
MEKIKSKINRSNLVWMIISVIIIISSFVLFYVKYITKEMLYFICGLSLIIIATPFFINLFVESKKEKDKESMFLEFSRDLVEGVKSGTPISKCIMNVKTKDYGALNPYVRKLANQISIGIPVKDALEVFSSDIGSQIIKRAVGLIREAERAGGRIETILESVTMSVGQIQKLKKERKAAIYNLTVQGYIIFFIFIIIMLVMQFKIFPITTQLQTETQGMESLNLGSGLNIGQNAISPESLANSFLFLLIIQGFFAGIVIGKISEGLIKAGLKHSFILVAFAILISTGARVFLA